MRDEIGRRFNPADLGAGKKVRCFARPAHIRRPFASGPNLNDRARGGVAQDDRRKAVAFGAGSAYVKRNSDSKAP
jgi:hypothetical protein